MNASRNDSERGIALILVLVILPLVAIIMTQLSFETTIGERLAENVMTNQQFKQAIAARRRQVQQRLVRDLKGDEEGGQSEGGAFDHPSDVWGPDSEGGETALVVSKGDKDLGDLVTLYTQIADEQAKFNLNLLRHTDNKRRALAHRRLRVLLDLFRDSRYGDLIDNEYDLDGAEAQELSEAILKFVKGEERNEMVGAVELPAPAPEMKQGVFTIDDLAFCSPLIVEKRLLERFTDVNSGQVIPSLAEFLTVYGDGRINANTCPIQVLRALFTEEEGQMNLAEALFHSRGGFLNTEEDQDLREERQKEREDAAQDGTEEETEESAYRSVNDLNKVEGMSNTAYLRREELEVGRDFTVRSNFYSIVITAQRDNFLRQHRLVLERHVAGTLTWESEVRTADSANLPEGVSSQSAESSE